MSTPKSAPIFARRPIKVICVGAGFSGIHLAARIRQYAPEVQLSILEKQSSIGGVWSSNTYPGVASDLPAHIYTLSWAPWAEWSRYYPTGEEVQKYIAHCAEKAHLENYLRLAVSVQEAEWNNSTGLWKVTIKDEKTGEVSTETCNVLISATGANSIPKMPDITGLDSPERKIEIVHSSRWPKDLELKGKRIGVIGNGASALQIIPQMHKQASKLTCFMRSASWIWSSWFHPVRDQFWGLKEPESLLTEDLEVINPQYTEEHKETFRNDVQALQKHRHDIESFLMMGSPQLFQRDSDIQKMMITGFTQLTQFKLQKKPELMELFLPDWAPLCRRGSPAPGFFETLVSDNVVVAKTGVKEIKGTNTLVCDDGTKHELDVLVCASGFDTSGAPPFKITGVNNTTLNGQFEKDPDSYLSVSLQDMPNFFTFNGPLFPGWSVIPRTGEVFGDYMLRFILKLQQHRYKSFTPRVDAIKGFTKHADQFFVPEKSPFADNCKSWYKADNGKGKVRYMWPGSSYHLFDTFAEPLFENYEWEANDEENRVSWLGNGVSRYELCPPDAPRDPAPYFQSNEAFVQKEVPAFRGENSKDAWFPGGIANARS